MNERIKELAKEAGITTNLNTDFFNKDANQWVDYFSEKFAELIIKECYDVLMTGDRYRRDYFADKILKHFGVE